MSDHGAGPAAGWSPEQPAAGALPVGYGTPPPALLPGRSYRSWFALHLGWLLGGLALVLPLTVLSGVWHRLGPVVLALLVVWILGLVYPTWMVVRRGRAEHRAGYSTLKEAKKYPTLWVLDAKTGAVISPPIVILVDDSYTGVVDGHRVQRRGAFRAAQRRKTIKVLAIGIPLALLAGGLRWEVDQRLIRMDQQRRQAAAFTPAMPITEAAMALNASTNAWLQVRNVEQNLLRLPDPARLSGTARQQQWQAYVNLLNDELAQLPQWERILRRDLRLPIPAHATLDKAGLAAFDQARLGYRYLASLYAPGDAGPRWRNRTTIEKNLVNAEAQVIGQLDARCGQIQALDPSEAIECRYLARQGTAPTP